MPSHRLAVHDVIGLPCFPVFERCYHRGCGILNVNPGHECPSSSRQWQTAAAQQVNERSRRLWSVERSVAQRNALNPPGARRLEDLLLQRTEGRQVTFQFLRAPGRGEGLFLSEDSIAPVAKAITNVH